MRADLLRHPALCTLPTLPLGLSQFQNQFSLIHLKLYLIDNNIFNYLVLHSASDICPRTSRQGAEWKCPSAVALCVPIVPVLGTARFSIRSAGGQSDEHRTIGTGV